MYAMQKEMLTFFETDYCRKIEKRLRKMTPGFAPEAIHQFRLSVKKLRAFYRMLSGNKNAGLHLKISHQLKSCYRIAGVIRNLQLQQQRINKASVSQNVKPLSYLHLLHYKIGQLKPMLAGMIALHPAVKIKLKKNGKRFQKLTLIHFNEYAAGKLNVIKEIIKAGSFTDSELHAIRKSLKDLFYNERLFKRDNNDKVLPNLITELGNFQDKAAALSFMKPLWWKKINKNEQKTLRQLKQQWIADKAASKKSLAKKLEKYFCD